MKTTVAVGRLQHISRNTSEEFKVIIEPMEHNITTGNACESFHEVSRLNHFGYAFADGKVLFPHSKLHILTLEYEICLINCHLWTKMR
jgi:hypothetical protein